MVWSISVSEIVERIDYSQLPIGEVRELYDIELDRLHAVGVASPAVEIVPVRGVRGLRPIVAAARGDVDLLGVEEVRPVDMNETPHALRARQAGQFVMGLAVYLTDAYSVDRRASGLLYLSGIYNRRRVVYGVPSVYGMPDDESADFFVRVEDARLTSSLFVPNPTKDINDLLTMAEALRLELLIGEDTVRAVGERLAKDKWC